jgi:hypothetical protein
VVEDEEEVHFRLGNCTMEKSEKTRPLLLGSVTFCRAEAARGPARSRVSRRGAGWGKGAVQGREDRQAGVRNQFPFVSQSHDFILFYRCIRVASGSGTIYGMTS